MRARFFNTKQAWASTQFTHDMASKASEIYPHQGARFLSSARGANHFPHTHTHTHRGDGATQPRTKPIHVCMHLGVGVTISTLLYQHEGTNNRTRTIYTHGNGPRLSSSSNMSSNIMIIIYHLSSIIYHLSSIISYHHQLATSNYHLS